MFGVAYIHHKGFLKYECEVRWKQPLTPPQHKTIVVYRISNHKLTVET